MSTKDNQNGEIVIFKTADEKVSVNVVIENETVWLTIDQMANLFDKSRSTINEHILNIYNEKELNEEETIRKIGNSDFSTKPTNYNKKLATISILETVQNEGSRQVTRKSYLNEMFI